MDASHRVTADERAHARETRRVGKERTRSNAFAKELVCRSHGCNDWKDARVHHERVTEVQVRVARGQAKHIAPPECNWSEVVCTPTSARQTVVPTDPFKRRKRQALRHCFAVRLLRDSNAQLVSFGRWRVSGMRHVSAPACANPIRDQR
jgi:hypothetical protein